MKVIWSAVTESPLWMGAEREPGLEHRLNQSVLNPFTRSALVESGDFIAALQNVHSLGCRSERWIARLE